MRFAPNCPAAVATRRSRKAWPRQPVTRKSVTVPRPPRASSGHSARIVKRGRRPRGRAIVPVRRRKSLRTSTASGADHGVANTAVSSASSLPSAVPRATQVQAPGRGNTDSRTSGCAKSGSGTTTRPVTEPSGWTVASSAQRMSASPPGGAGARTAPARPPGGGVARKLNGSPSSDGATRTPTANDAVVDGPERQSAAPPVPGPTETVTV